MSRKSAALSSYWLFLLFHSFHKDWFLYIFIFSGLFKTGDWWHFGPFKAT